MTHITSSWLDQQWPIQVCNNTSFLFFLMFFLYLLLYLPHYWTKIVSVSLPVGFVPTWLITEATLLSCGLDKISSSTSDFCELAGCAALHLERMEPHHFLLLTPLPSLCKCHVTLWEHSCFFQVDSQYLLQYPVTKSINTRDINSWLFVAYWLKYWHWAPWLNNQSGLIYTLCECLQCGI